MAGHHRQERPLRGRLAAAGSRRAARARPGVPGRKHFEGCAGLQIANQVRVTIAAQACILLLHRQDDYYPRLVSILVYPSTYLVPGGGDVRADGLPSDAPQARLGESWARNLVVLAWDSVVSPCLRSIQDGHNVVLHEFAHQLDQDNGVSDGAPISSAALDVRRFGARVLGRDFEQLVRDTERHHRTLIDRYGATNPAEFFAVVTETFFEKPRQLRSKYPELYLQLQQFYAQDPAALAVV